MLNKEFDKFKEIQGTLLKDNPTGGFVVIKGDEVLGVWNDRGDALKAGVETYGNVPFLVRNIQEDLDDPANIINFSRHIQFA